MKKTAKKIIGQRVYLRPLKMSDASERYRQWFNDPEVNRYLEVRSLTPLGMKDYLVKKIKDPSVLFMGIFDKENDVHIGNTKLEPLTPGIKRTIFTIVIGDKSYWGKGIGQEVTELITDYALNELGLEEVELGVISLHERAIHAYEKAGYKKVGLREKALNHDGMIYNVVVMVKRREDIKKKT